MNQCVPSWDLDDPAVVAGGGGRFNHPVPAAGAAHRVAVSAAGTTRGGTFAPFAVPMSDQYYEVAELTWEKGNISSHGLLNRPAPSKDAPAAPPQLQGIGGGGGVAGDRETLEAVVGEAAAWSHFLSQPPVHHQAPSWLGAAAGAVARTGADALVPCDARVVDEAQEGGDAADASRRKRARVVGEGGELVCASQGSAAPGRRGESALLTLDGGCDTGADDLYGFTTTTNNSTSLDRGDKGSPDTENTSIGGGASDSRCFSRPSQQRDGLCDEEENVVINGDGAVRSSISTKRSRAAAIHNESERKRRDRINQKMKTLQKLVPNSSKTDKASMLDEVIDYLKQLQAQVQVMSRMSSMMMPMAMPQLQMSVMAQMAHMAQMAQMAQGMMNMGSLAQQGYAGLTTPPMIPPFVPMSWDPTAASASTAAAGAGAGTSVGVVGTDRAPQPGGAVPDAFSAFLACQAQQNGQQQPGSMEAYNKMVALYQKMSQQQQHGLPSNSPKQ